MSDTPKVSYPGVYVQEIPSDVRTINPVDTATTAFVGRALRGPTNEPIVIHNFGDFQNVFGGLWLKSTLGYTVSDFFLNGGRKAVIIRVYTSSESDGPTPSACTVSTRSDQLPAHSKATITIPGANGGIELEARDPGAWSNQLRVRIEKEDPEIAKAMAERYDIANPDELFNLLIHDKGTGETEVFQHVTVVDGPRQVAQVVEQESRRVVVTTARGRPTAHQEAADNPDESIWDAAGTCSAPDQPGADGEDLNDLDVLGSEEAQTGIYALKKADIFNLLCIPPYNGPDVHPDVVLSKANALCIESHAMLILDSPSGWTTMEAAKTGFPKDLIPPNANAALFFPRIKKSNPLRDNQIEEFVPCGIIAGLFARTDAARGIWKAPAGLEAGLRGVSDLSVHLTDAENGELNNLGINCLRTLPGAGHVNWGARTMRGDNRLADQWKYIAVRRITLFIEQSFYRGSQWAVFEPNDEPLWAQLRLNMGSFLHGLFVQGAFQGGSPDEAYFVHCDRNTTTQADIDRGIVNIHIGIAPLRPAEFIVIYIQQIAGELTT